MNENMIRKAALFMLVFMIAGIPFSFGEAYAAAGEKAVDDTYEIDLIQKTPHSTMMNLIGRRHWANMPTLPATPRSSTD